MGWQFGLPSVGCGVLPTVGWGQVLVSAAMCCPHIGLPSPDHHHFHLGKAPTSLFSPYFLLLRVRLKFQLVSSSSDSVGASGSALGASWYFMAASTLLKILFLRSGLKWTPSCNPE